MSILFNAIERIRDNEKEQQSEPVPSSGLEVTVPGTSAASPADVHSSPLESVVPATELAGLSVPVPDEYSPDSTTLLVLEDGAAAIIPSVDGNHSSAPDPAGQATSADNFSSATAFVEECKIDNPPQEEKPYEAEAAEEVREAEEEKGAVIEQKAADVQETKNENEATREVAANLLKARVSWVAFAGVLLVAAFIFLWIFPGASWRDTVKSSGPLAGGNKSSGGTSLLSGKGSKDANVSAGGQEKGTATSSPNSSMVELNNLGVKAVREKDPWRALYYFERAAKLEPKAAAPLINMSITLSELGLTAPATRIFQDAQALNPEHPALRDYLSANRVAGRRGR